MEEFIEFDLQSSWALLKRWWWLLTLVTLCCALSAYFVSKFIIAPIYEARTVLLIDTPDTKSDDYTSLMTSEKLTRTYSELMTTRPVMLDVINRLGLDRSIEALKAAIKIQPISNTQLIEIRVRDNNAALAAQIANTLAAVFVEQHQALQAYRYKESKARLATQLTQLDQQTKDTSTALESLGEGAEKQVEREILQVLLAQYRQNYANLLQIFEQVQISEASATASIIQMENAYPPSNPVSPKVLTNTILASVVGFMFVVGFIVLLEALDNTIKKPDQIVQHLQLPVLGTISGHNAEAGKPITVADPRSQVSESFRTLRTNIQFSNVDSFLGTLLVTSPMLGDGKSTVAANLGIVLAQNGQRVILLDADLRRPSLHKIFALRNRPGLSRLFVQPPLELEEAIQPTDIPGLSVIPAGYLPPNPLELVGSDKMGGVLRQALEKVDIVIIDAPPVTAVSDAAVLAKRVDGVLLVVSSGHTLLEAAKDAIEQLNRAGTKLIGVVMNDKKSKRMRYGYY